MIVLLGVLIMFYLERLKRGRVPQGMAFSSFFGFAAGFTTMIGNLAGPFANVYFLAKRIPKKEFIGTTAMLFFIINLFKVPFHVFTWGSVNMYTLKIDLKLIPIVVLGFLVGLSLVKRISEQNYRYFILAVTALGAIFLFFR